MPTLFSPEAIKSRIRWLEDWWFDKTRSVQTAGLARVPDRSQIVGDLSDSNMYGPVRVSNARHAVRALPIKSYADYTFIDIGSGKGRMLFIAAEFPFRKVLGVEFGRDFHEKACANIQRYHSSRQRCTDIQSIRANAAEFVFPTDNLVLFLFNPFGPEIMSRMLRNLERSIAEHPRHVIITLLWPELTHLVADSDGFQLYEKTRRHHIYQTRTTSP